MRWSWRAESAGCRLCKGEKIKGSASFASSASQPAQAGKAERGVWTRGPASSFKIRRRDLKPNPAGYIAVLGDHLAFDAHLPHVAGRGPRSSPGASSSPDPSGGPPEPLVGFGLHREVQDLGTDPLQDPANLLGSWPATTTLSWP